MNTPFVCKQPDDYTEEYHLRETYWTVKLSNGEYVMQDDNRPGVEPHSAWLRLAEYVRQNRLSIKEMWVQFRSHVESTLPADADGYFFRKCAMGFLFDNSTYGFYLIGYLHNGKVRVQKWKVPELLLVEEEERDPADDSQVGQSLIRNEYGETARLENAAG